MRLGTNADYILANSTTSANKEYKTYTVQPGDSLSVIAGKVLGDPSRWKEIFNINPNISDPDVISVGQVINIPAGAVASSTSLSTGPRTTALVDDSGDYEEEEGDTNLSFLNSPMFLVGAAGVALLIILMATKKSA